MRCYSILTMLCVATPSHAEVTRYINKAAWQTAIGDHSTITFQGFPEHTLITNQYESLGVQFTDGNDRILYNDSLLNDEIGLQSSDLHDGLIHLQFAQPVYGVAADFLSRMQIQIYKGGALMHTSDFSNVQGRFGGVISSVPFDAAIIRDFDGVVVIDDLFFGPPIPAPGALGLLVMAACHRRRRRRSESGRRLARAGRLTAT